MNAFTPIIMALVTGMSSVALAQGEPPRAVGFPQYPSLSPDGSTVVFSFAGDLWAVPSGGGTARRITSHPSDELRSAFSPDGSLLAFESERDGARAIYTMPVGKDAGGLTFGDVRRVTRADRAHTLSAFTADSKGLYLAGSHEPALARGTRMYRANADGTGALTRLTLAYGAAPTPLPGDTGIIFTRGRYDPNRPIYRGSATTDLYRLDFATGTFTQLTSNAANDADGRLLPDGSLVFVSSRDGQNNVWRLPKATADAAATQLTFFKPAPGEATIGHGVRDFSVAPGGTTGVFAVWDRLYTLDLAAARPQPKPLAVTLTGDFSQVDTQRLNLSRLVSEAALSPDGKTLAVIARGEVYVRSTEKDRPTRRVTNTHARERDLAWSPDGSVLYFTSDETGVYGVYAARVALTREDLQPKKAEETADKPADKPDDAKGDKEAMPKVDHGKRWSESLTFTVEPVLVEGDNLRRPRPSPDGKYLLLTRSRGDLVLLTIADKAQRVVLPGWDEPDASWCSDSRHVIYARNDEYFNSDIWVMDVLTDGAEAANITRHPDDDSSPRLSADGKVLYFLSDRDASVNGEYALYAVNLDVKLDGMSAYELADYFKEAAEAAKKRKPLGSEEKPEKKDKPKKKDEPAKDAPEEEGAAAAEAPKDPPPAEEPKAEEPPKAPEPLKFDVADAYRRVRQVVSMPGGVGDLAITPGGERVIFSGSIDGSASLFSVDYRGRERKSVTSGSTSNVTVNLTGEKVVYVATGEASIGKPAGGESEKMSIDATVMIDVAQQQRQKFLEAARILGEVFYHNTLKGLDWPALTARYLSLAMATRTDTEFNAVGNALFGELDGSHLGIRGGRDTSGEQVPFGYLGVDAEPTNDGWRVARVLAQGPATRPTSTLNVGDVIVAINGDAVAKNGGPVADLPVLLAGTSGKETLLKVRSAEGAERLVLVTPIGSGADTGLRYDDEVARRAAIVERLSGGKLGYLHIRSMDLPSVRDFERDLYAAAHGKVGLIIDVRDNGGGWTADILLASLTAPRHAYTVPRGADEATMPRDAYPRDRRLIYHYNRPISVLINQNSYSNAEIFPHAIKTIGRGKLVGVQTFGAVISTGSASLIDGTTVRTPFRGWRLLDGTDMENHGAMPDIPAGMPPEAEAKGDDPQIAAAVTELLERAARTPFWDGR
ncbi:MAG: hypothetical protein HBSAPP03_13310 [Phycisphaerae bacterium]|nr:MAG: hypothetical protein HBSAPP03_13310 [Phycisphaerae bacterium]